MSVAEIVKAYRALSAAEQAEVKALLAEDAAEAAPPISPELEAELHRRVAAAKANPGVGYTMEEVIASVKRKNWR